MKLSHFDTDPNVTESNYAQVVPLVEDSDIPVPGDTIRTPKLEGKVSKVEEGYVYFTTADGRNMRNTIQNCTVVEKLADQESGMFEDEEIDEVSTELLAKYKTAAGKDASAADKKGDYARGNKRFSGIVKATKKQFANDAKKRKVDELTIPGVEDNFTADDIKRLEQISDLATLKAQAKVLVKGKAARRMKPEKISWFYNAIDGKMNRMAVIKLMYDLLLAGEGNSVVGTRNSMRQNDYRDRFGEGSMGGINRSAPSNDVSYEKVLDEVYGKWNEEQVNELSVGKLQAYKDAAKSPASFKNRPLRKLARTIQGVKGASDRIDTKTGNRRPAPGPERGNNESIDEADMGDLVRGQQQPPAPRKAVPIEYNGWTIKYRKASKPTDRVDWVIYNHKMELAHQGESGSDKDAVADAQAWIDSGAGKSREITGKATIDFNSKFTQQFGENFFANIDTDNGKPVLILSYEAQGGLKRSHMRNQRDKLTDTAVKLYSIPMSPKESTAAGLVPNGRYMLGPKDDLGDGLWAFPLELHSVAQSKTDRFVLPTAGLTVATERDVDEAITPWGGYTADDPKANALAKAPKSAMQGKGNIRFSELVQDSIKAHGLKWAFNEYVIKHGLPPRQFQIFAGLTTKAKAKEPAKADWTDPSKTTTPAKPQSWWQKLRGKLPFEE